VIFWRPIPVGQRSLGGFRGAVRISAFVVAAVEVVELTILKLVKPAATV
jgi:hypothetical protein